MTAKKETEPTEAPLGINAAILQVMRAVGHIAKAREANQYRFRGIDDVYNALHDHMVEAGIFTTSDIIETIRSEGAYKSGSKYTKVALRITYHFNAKDGSSISTTVIGEGDDQGDKAGNKALAVAHKYALLQMFMIPTEEAKDPEDKRTDPLQQGQQAGQFAGAPSQRPQQRINQNQSRTQAPPAQNGINAEWSTKYFNAATKRLEEAKTTQDVLKVAGQIKVDQKKLLKGHVDELRGFVILRMKELKEAFAAKAT